MLNYSYCEKRSPKGDSCHGEWRGLGEPQTPCPSPCPPSRHEPIRRKEVIPRTWFSAMVVTKSRYRKIERKIIDNICRELLPFLGEFPTGIVPRLYDVFAEEAD
jgi:hypothetical protein